MRKSNRLWIAIFLFPSIILFLIIFAFPICTVLFTSVTNWRMNKPVNFIGIANFIELFTNDTTFLAALFNTLKWIFLQCTVYVGIGVLVALMTANNSIFSRFVKVVYLIPNVISSAALAMLFYFVFNPSIGIVNSFLRIIGFTDFKKNWYFEYDTAFLTVTLTTIFFAGIICLLVSSRIAAISISIFEAAKIDGASNLTTAIYITLPIIKNIIGTAMILAASGALKAFEVIFLTTGGGPGTKTVNLSIYLYNIHMRSDKFGYGNSVGTVMLIIGMIIILLINHLFREREIS